MKAYYIQTISAPLVLDSRKDMTNGKDIPPSSEGRAPQVAFWVFMAMFYVLHALPDNGNDFIAWTLEQGQMTCLAAAGFCAIGYRHPLCKAACFLAFLLCLDVLITDWVPKDVAWWVPVLESIVLVAVLIHVRRKWKSLAGGEETGRTTRLDDVSRAWEGR